MQACVIMSDVFADNAAAFFPLRFVFVKNAFDAEQLFEQAVVDALPCLHPVRRQVKGFRTAVDFKIMFGRRIGNAIASLT